MSRVISQTVFPEICVQLYTRIPCNSTIFIFKSSEVPEIYEMHNQLTYKLVYFLTTDYNNYREVLWLLLMSREHIFI